MRTYGANYLESENIGRGTAPNANTGWAITHPVFADSSLHSNQDTALPQFTQNLAPA